MPENYDYILTDPRGAGCNRIALPDSAYTTENLADDVLEVIRNERLDRYITAAPARLASSGTRSRRSARSPMHRQKLRAVTQSVLLRRRVHTRSGTTRDRAGGLHSRETR